PAPRTEQPAARLRPEMPGLPRGRETWSEGLQSVQGQMRELPHAKNRIARSALQIFRPSHSHREAKREVSALVCEERLEFRCARPLLGRYSCNALIMRALT